MAIERGLNNRGNGKVSRNRIDRHGSQDQASCAKHTLLATAANRDYQRCYKALKLLDKYWAGTRYILTALDQKAKGIPDPLLYNVEDLCRAARYPDLKLPAAPFYSNRENKRNNSTEKPAAYMSNLSRLIPPDSPLLQNENLTSSQGQLSLSLNQFLAIIADEISSGLVFDWDEQ